MENKELLFYSMDVKDVIEKMSSSYEGLSEEEAVRRIEKYGKNVLPEQKQKTIFERFINQFKDLMVIILIIAAIISGLIGEMTDAAIILVVVILNAVLGVVQESKAEKALDALKKMSSPYAKVKRSGTIKQIKTEDIVSGDIVFIEAGDFVPADMRLIESASLKIEESALTGESVPVEKTTDKIDKANLVIGDRVNMAYSGSTVVYGRGMGIVTSTGIETEVGKIAENISGAKEDETPLQKKLKEISKYLTIGVIAVCIIIFIAGVLEGRDYFDMFLIAISLAVAAIPEGLLAVITIVLALGVQKMARKNAIIRNISSVETLGSTEIICTDKTGTLTQNKMAVKEAYIDGSLIDSADLLQKRYPEEFMQVLLLCNDSKMTSEEGDKHFIGDPTEIALVNFAYDLGFIKDEIERIVPRKGEIPFDSERKLMTTINEYEGKYRVLTKGAPDMLLKRCKNILVDGRQEKLTDDILLKIKESNAKMANKALRVLGLAYKDIESLPDKNEMEDIEGDLIFVGLIGMMDPPRQEVKEAVNVCKSAGIRPIMITGDYKDTALAIAKEIGIAEKDDEIITGSEIDEISDSDFEKNIEKYSAYARVSPEHKVKIVKAWKSKGKIVAMTGDGVNDAPALKASDIGIGMGITGTDVAKSVSDMILADDNFATIVSAVKEGRRIYNNIRNSVRFLLSSNLAEVFTLFVATLLNWKILMPIHILWINLITDSLPALALGVEKAEEKIMNKKPRKAKSSFFAEGVGASIIYQGILIGSITLAVFYIGNALYNQKIAETMAFATLGIIQLVHSQNIRSNEKSVFKVGMFSNKYLNFAVLLSGLLQVVVILTPKLNEIFKVESLNFVQWGIVLIASISIIPFVEVVKLVKRRLYKIKID